LTLRPAVTLSARDRPERVTVELTVPSVSPGGACSAEGMRALAHCPALGQQAPELGHVGAKAHQLFPDVGLVSQQGRFHGQARVVWREAVERLGQALALALAQGRGHLGIAGLDGLEQAQALCQALFQLSAQGRALARARGVMRIEDEIVLIYDLDRFLSLDDESMLDAALSGGEA